MEQTSSNFHGCCGVKKTGSKVKLSKAKHRGRNETALLHPDHASQLMRLNRIIGQIEGVKRMIESRRYCPEILVQTRAISSAIRAVDMGIIEKHVRHCVTEALVLHHPKDIDRKIEELITVLDRF